MCKRKGWEEVNEVSVFGGCDGKRKKKEKGKGKRLPHCNKHGRSATAQSKSRRAPSRGPGQEMGSGTVWVLAKRLGLEVFWGLLFRVCPPGQ